MPDVLSVVVAAVGREMRACWSENEAGGEERRARLLMASLGGKDGLGRSVEGVCSI